LIKLEYMAKMYYRIIKHVKRISEMIKAGESTVLRKKPVPVPLHSPQIPRAQAWDQTWASIIRGVN
jgi:hypothetical protein